MAFTLVTSEDAENIDNIEKLTGHKIAVGNALGVPMDRTDESLIALRRILRATEIYGRDLARDAGLTAVQLRVLQIVAEKGR